MLGPQALKSAQLRAYHRSFDGHPLNVCFSVNGVTWKLFKGTVSTWTVFSFVAPSEITSYSSDLKPFLSPFIVPFLSR